MSNNLKCPFCQQELQEDVGYDGDYSCPNCREPYFGSPELWQELIKLMEKNKDLSDKNGKLETELDRTRKALDVALCSLQDIAESDGDFITGASTPLDEHEYADMMLKEIKRQMKIKTALEQKD